MKAVNSRKLQEHINTYRVHQQVQEAQVSAGAGPASARDGDPAGGVGAAPHVAVDHGVELVHEPRQQRLSPAGSRVAGLRCPRPFSRRRIFTPRVVRARPHSTNGRWSRHPGTSRMRGDHWKGR
ncbi:hypothetical protein CEXT_599501 [Caerostris extrusa]|uniref:Uncharacterized protein n=1 Tax=Caerostris extrusa TaxID=172846 RepID=A0AAV4TDC0_CAEEX|nr:hypothetical protein CEXT_599501 [Caerostris extrusa]